MKCRQPDPPSLLDGIAALKRRRRTQSGFSLVELIVAFSILIVLSTLAVPLARYQVRRQREEISSPICVK